MILAYFTASLLYAVNHRAAAYFVLKYQLLMKYFWKSTQTKAKSKFHFTIQQFYLISLGLAYRLEKKMFHKHILSFDD